MLRKIDRILLRVPSLPAAVRYYTESLGMKLVKQDQRLANLRFADNDTELVLHSDPDLALETHAREELGLDPDEGLGSPFGAAFSSLFTFAFGAFVPLLPFLIGSGHAATLASILASATTLFTVGALMSIMTGKRFYLSGSRMLVIGLGLAAITYGVGRLLHVGSSAI